MTGRGQPNLGLKRGVCEAVDRHARRVLDVIDDIGRHPELGYREVRTASVLAREFEHLGLPVERDLALTGVKALLTGARPGPTVAVLGEMDGLPIPGHPGYDSSTGAAHACGHHAQLGMMLAVAYALCEVGAAADIAGRVAFFAVPAEESVEVGWRMTLRDEGLIEFLGGKQELVRLGAFDDVDLAMLTHAATNDGNHLLTVGGSWNGHLIKEVSFCGRSAHAGLAPHEGVNALKAAVLAIQGIDAQRETFRDDDCVRVHPIITRGGDVVNAVPSQVDVETFVRARTVEAIIDANRKVDRAVRAGADAMGAGVRVRTVPGYLPLREDPMLVEIYRRNATAIVGTPSVGGEGHRCSTTDLGDLGHLMPVVHPFVKAWSGTPHATDFVIAQHATVLAGAKAMATTIVDLLVDGGALANAVVEARDDRMGKDEYLALMRSLAYEENVPMDDDLRRTSA